MKDEERPAAQHYKALLAAFSLDYRLTCPVALQKTELRSRDIRTRLRFNSLFEIEEFNAVLHILDAAGKTHFGEIEFGIWITDGVMEVFESRLLPEIDTV